MANIDPTNRDNLNAVPDALVTLLIGGENPVRVWRKFRDISCQGLSERSHLPEHVIIAIEQDEHEPSAEECNLLGEALDCDPRALVRLVKASG